jgi:hypothetical protein
LQIRNIDGPLDFRGVEANVLLVARLFQSSIVLRGTIKWSMWAGPNPIHVQYVGGFFEIRPLYKTICESTTTSMPATSPVVDENILADVAFIQYEVVRILDGGGGGRCLRCGKTFTLFQSAKRHFKLVHTPIKPPPPCSICFRSFRNDMSLKHHLRTVHQVYQK